jgi:hypothetical protein
MLDLASHRFYPFHDGVNVYLHILTERQVYCPGLASRLQPRNHLISSKET